MHQFKRLVTAAGIGSLALFANAASAATITVTSSVDQSGFLGNQNAASYPLTATPYTFTGQVNSFANVTAIDSIAVELSSILDGDTGQGDFDFDNLTLGLDGINTGLKLNGMGNNSIATIDATQLAPTLQAALIAALQDGQLVGTILDATPGNSTPAGDQIGVTRDFLTTLDLTLSGASLDLPGNNGGGQVPLPAGVLLAPIGVATAGFWKRRFRAKTK